MYMCENLASEVMPHKNCRRQLSDLTYLPCGFNEYDNNTNGDNRNSNYNDNIVLARLAKWLSVCLRTRWLW